MRIKLCWIPFIPAIIAIVFLKYIEVTLPSGGTFFGLGGFGLIYSAIAVLPILYILCSIISLFDKKTSQYYSLNKNIGASLFSFLAAVGVLFNSVMYIFTTVSNASAEGVGVLSMIEAVFGIAAGISLLFISSCHLSGKNSGKSLALFMLVPTIWAGLKMGVIFQSLITVSVLVADVMDMLCYALVALFIFSDAMLICNIEGKNTVNSCFVKGFTLITAVAASSTKAIYKIVNNFGAYDLTTIIDTAVTLCFGLYALAVLIELTVKALPKNAVAKPRETSADDEEPPAREYVSFLYHEDKSSDQVNIYEAEKSTNNADGNNVAFLTPDENNGVLQSDKAREVSEKIKIKSRTEVNSHNVPDNNNAGNEAVNNNDGVDKKETENSANTEEVKTEHNFVTTKKQESGDELKTRMDEIDKLILEIQSRNTDD